MKKITISLFSLLLLSGCLSSDPYDDTDDIAFLEEYAQQSGVTTDPETGLLYRVISHGDGHRPGSNDPVTFVDAEGELAATGESVLNTFDNDEPPPFLFLDDPGVFAGLRVGVQLMNARGIYEFVLPTHLAAGDGRVYKYRVELHNTQEGFLAEYAQREDVTVTESGLRYRVIEEGNGEETPDGNSTVIVNYEGTLINGQEFDSGESAVLALNGVIDGFSEGLQLMTPGSMYEFLIPSDLAYGDSPRQGIYSGAALMFEVELLEIQ